MRQRHSGHSLVARASLCLPTSGDTPTIPEEDQEGTRTILVAPYWPKHLGSWTLSMAEVGPIQLHLREDLLSQGSAVLLNLQWLDLMACF